jgi:PKD repeat protein
LGRPDSGVSLAFKNRKLSVAVKKTTFLPVLPAFGAYFSVNASCFLILCAVFLFQNTTNAQSVSIAGIINRYAAVSAIDTCTGRIAVSDTSGFRKGGSVMIMQMQGAGINNSNNSSYGQVQSYNVTGRFEKAIIDSVAFQAIYLRNRLLYIYTPASKVQLITYPVFPNATITDTLRAKAWDGTTGGILAFEVSGTLTMNAPMVVNGCGFRGGAPYANPSNNCSWALPETAYLYAAGNWRGAFKGEGIALMEVGKELGRGPQANGGGGGNDHNSGGGGGGNLSNGGKGGENDEPSTFGCSGHLPGLGGNGILSTNNRIYLGGGGGAGHANNLLNSGGGAGGGVVLIKAKYLAGLEQKIFANGQSPKLADGDGGGGGGAGGSILLDLGNPSSGLLVYARGGKGGNTNANNQNRCFGPGGGGGGGRVIANQPVLTYLEGGQAGVVTNSSNGCNGNSNNGSAGQDGALETFTPIPQENALVYVPQVIQSPFPQSVCVGKSAIFSVSANGGNWQYQWQLNTGTGWQNIGNAQGYTGFKTNTLKLTTAGNSQNGYQYRCIVSRVGCSEVTSLSTILTIKPAPIAAFSINLNGSTLQLTNMATNFTGIYWSFGDGTFSSDPNTAHTYITGGNYVVTQYAFNDCDTNAHFMPVLITLAPKAGFLVADTTKSCETAEVIFANAATNATSYNWSFPGGNPAVSTLSDPLVTYSISGNYMARQIVSNAAGSDTFEFHFYVQVDKVPLANFVVASIFNGTITVNNMSTPGALCTWNFGDGSADIVAQNPTYQYTQSGVFTITLAVTNPCGASILQSQIQVTIVAVSSPKVPVLPLIYPNPADQQCTVDCSKLETLPLRARLYDAGGRLVQERQTDHEIIWMMQTHDLPSGIYQLQLVLPTTLLVVPICIR